MFQDVWNASSIGRVGLETDAEYIVIIISGYMKIVGASLIVGEVQCR